MDCQRFWGDIWRKRGDIWRKREEYNEGAECLNDMQRSASFPQQAEICIKERNIREIIIHLNPKWRPINCSFVCMLISPLCLLERDRARWSAGILDKKRFTECHARIAERAIQHIDRQRRRSTRSRMANQGENCYSSALKILQKGALWTTTGRYRV